MSDHPSKYQVATSRLSLGEMKTRCLSHLQLLRIVLLEKVCELQRSVELAGVVIVRHEVVVDVIVVPHPNGVNTFLEVRRSRLFVPEHFCYPIHRSVVVPQLLIQRDYLTLFSQKIKIKNQSKKDSPQSRSSRINNFTDCIPVWSRIPAAPDA